MDFEILSIYRWIEIDVRTRAVRIKFKGEEERSWIGSVIVVNYVVDRIAWIEDGVESVKKKGEKKERMEKIAQGGNDYEIWKSHRVRWGSWHEARSAK